MQSMICKSLLALGPAVLLSAQPVSAAQLRAAPKVDALVASNLHPDPKFAKNGTDWIFLNPNHSFETVAGLGKALKHSGTGSFQDSHITDVNVVFGEKINVEFYAMRPVTTRWSGNGFGIHFHYRDASGRSIQYVEHYVTLADLPAGTPTLLKFSHIAPAGAISARLVHSIRDTFPAGAVGYTARPRISRDDPGHY